MAVDIQQITGAARSVSELLSNTRYGLDFYQREYNWGEAQVAELIDDLAGRFLDQFDPNHERPQVESYRPYFLGPIVTAQRDAVRYLVDGQQRMTTLSLLVIYLSRCLKEEYPEDSNSLGTLIFSSSYGQKTFSLDVEERKKCLEAILEGRFFDFDNEPDSVRNLWNRYETIVERFPDDLRGRTLPYFADWLLNRVLLVNISAPDQDMALEIFETMNDRGLRLNNTDMLKSFLLARVGDEDLIRDLNNRWRQQITLLTDADKNADAEFVKAWLRGNYARSQRERKANATPRDFDIIGTSFHKWVRDNADEIGLKRQADYRRFVENEFFTLSRRYLQLLNASHDLQPGLEAVFYNAQTGFTLQLPVILAAITPDDGQDTFVQKSALIAGALDIFVARRMVNFRNFGYSTVVYTMFNLIKEVRNRPIEEVRERLAEWLEGEDDQFDGIRAFRLTQRNRKHIRYLLARITAWLDYELATGLTFMDYWDRSGKKNPFEIEHIWANHPERHYDEFEGASDFDDYRNRIGGLLLLPKDFNASFGDMPYEEKVDHYNAQNPLARSLHPMAYKNNPTFRQMCISNDLEFQAYPSTFSKNNVDERQELYRRLAEIVWSPVRLGLT